MPDRVGSVKHLPTSRLRRLSGNRIAYTCCGHDHPSAAPRCVSPHFPTEPARPTLDPLPTKQARRWVHEHPPRFAMTVEGMAHGPCSSS